MRESKEQQLFFMQWAIRLGEQGRCSAPPNPWVGCLIVKEGQILGEGYHQAPGRAHAEKIALEKAGALAKGATAYVSLEPCSHHGRTPPCADALIEAGVSRVVIPLVDPDPLVSGKGIEKLKQAGIEVVVGVGKEEAEKSLRPYLYHRRNKRPFCLLKSAMSIDGRTAAADGSSRWITGTEARADVHQLRAESQAIMVGSATALHDKPRLDVRGIEVLKQPKRVVLDSSGQVPAQGPLADPTVAPTLIFTSSSRYIKDWEQCGATVYLLEKWDLTSILSTLASQGVLQLLIEGGSTLHAAFVKENLIDQMVIYVGNCLLGETGKPLLTGLTIDNIDQAKRWSLEGVRRFDQDVRLDFLPLGHLEK